MKVTWAWTSVKPWHGQRVLAWNGSEHQKLSGPLWNMQRVSSQQQEPLLPHAVPERPWQKVGADIFTLYSRDYLLVVDYFSKFPEICHLESKTASSVVVKIKSIFARHGIPDELVADNMPFNSR